MKGTQAYYKENHQTTHTHTKINRTNEQRQTTHENKLENGNRYITHTN